MATGIPTFRVDLAEGMIDVDTSADRLFAYCIEADKGPVNTPTFVASNKEAMRIFGVDFAPHFYQNPTGLVICRVEFKDMAPGVIEYKGLVEVTKEEEDEQGNKTTTTSLVEKTLLTVKAISPGPCKHKVKISQALVGNGLSLTVDIDGVTSKNYQNLKTLKKVAERINNRFSDYLEAKLSPDFDEATFKNENLNKTWDEEQGKAVETEVTGELLGGTNGYMLDATGEKAGAGFTQVEVKENSVEGFVGNRYYITSNAKVETSERYPLFTDVGKTETGMYVAITAKTTENNKDYYEFTSYGAADATEPLATGKVELTGEVGTKYIEVDDKKQGINVPPAENQSEDQPNADVTRIAAYREAFDRTGYVDVIGVAALSNSKVVRNVLIEHINYMIDPEVHSFRFGITSVLDADDTLDGVRTIESLKGVAEFINSEWIICVGQGVMFQKENELPVELKPYQAIQLYTGIRSSLGYSEAIFGGEQKKVLKGVVDTIPVVNDGTTIIKDDIVELNEAGICTFKKEYNEITFVEGVTTIQDEDVMSYENMMSIIAYVIRRLVAIAKPYQGQRLTEDLKSTLQTALSSELNTITSSDGTLMALEDFNIPPYDVQVYSAGKTKFDETNRLVRESKIIIQVRIVPIGALRDIDLHVIAI